MAEKEILSLQGETTLGSSPKALLCEFQVKCPWSAKL